jgi:hypothetical protein
METAARERRNRTGTESRELNLWNEERKGFAQFWQTPAIAENAESEGRGRPTIRLFNMHRRILELART